MERLSCELRSHLAALPLPPKMVDSGVGSGQSHSIESMCSSSEGGAGGTGSHGLTENPRKRVRPVDPELPDGESTTPRRCKRPRRMLLGGESGKRKRARLPDGESSAGESTPRRLKRPRRTLQGCREGSAGDSGPEPGTCSSSEDPVCEMVFGSGQAVGGGQERSTTSDSASVSGSGSGSVITPAGQGSDGGSEKSEANALDDGDKEEEEEEEEEKEMVFVNDNCQIEIQIEEEVVDANDGVNDEDDEKKEHANQPRISDIKGVRVLVVMQLVFQSLGVVYGDMGTSPLYAFPAIFTHGIKHEDDILGGLGLIYYTITLIPLFKYICIVLRATYNGEGGTFAMYSLVREHVKIGRYPKFLLFGATMIGASMVIGDGVLTPSMSVLSAVGGIKEATTKLADGVVAWISAAILVCLFAVQRFGTGTVGFAFAPVVFLWFLAIATIGIYNSVTYDHCVVKAFLPSYIVRYFMRNPMDAWISLGGVVLTVTGTEALYADVGHFSVLSIRLSMCCVAYPALMLAYTGQAAFLRRHPDLVAHTFYKSTPKEVYWPVFLLSVAASIVASQAMISATFSVIKQAVDIGCFPPIPISNPSQKHPGQIYISFVNYLLMAASVAVTFYFRTTANIGNAYGIAVMFVMVLTSIVLVIIMIYIWKIKLIFVILYVVVIGSIEIVFLTSVLYKFNQGGYLPLAFAMLLTLIMFAWKAMSSRGRKPSLIRALEYCIYSF